MSSTERPHEAEHSVGRPCGDFNSGHAINLEEPDEYNRIVGDFLSQVESSRCPHRDPRAVGASITGMKN